MNFLCFEGKSAMHVYLICIIFSLGFNFFFFEWDWFAYAFTFAHRGPFFSKETFFAYLPLIVILLGLGVSVFINILSRGKSLAAVVYALIITIGICFVTYFYGLITGSTVFTSFLKVSVIFWQAWLFVDPWLAKLWQHNTEEENKKTGAGSRYEDGSDENYDPNSPNGGTRGQLRPGHSKGH